MLAAMISLVRRELLIAYRKSVELLNPLWFFVIVLTLFPLSIGPVPKLLAKIAPGIIWVAALLAAMISFERLFRDDFQDGSLEQMMLTPTPLSAVVVAKVFAHWLLTAIPLIIISPLLLMLFSMTLPTWIATVLTLLLGTPALSFIGAIGVALTVGLKKGGVLLSLLILPLFIPVLIFSTSAIEAASLGMNYNGLLAILAAISVASVTLSPFAISAALRISIQSS